MVEILKFIFLGLIQGITELLPISSSGHVTFYSYIFKMDTALLSHFLVITNFGSFIAILIFYWKDVINLISSLFKKIGGNKEKDEQVEADFQLILQLIVAALPMLIVGFLVKDLLGESNLLSIGIAFLITSVFLIILYKKKKDNNTKEMTLKKSFIYGLIHTVALAPGISRSGTGYFAGLIQDVEIKKTIRFTFLLYLIISFFVSALGLYDLIAEQSSIKIEHILIALFTSFLGTFLLINVIYKVITFKNFKYFSIYALLMSCLSIFFHFWVN